MQLARRQSPSPTRAMRTSPTNKGTATIAKGLSGEQFPAGPFICCETAPFICCETALFVSGHIVRTSPSFRARCAQALGRRIASSAQTTSSDERDNHGDEPDYERNVDKAAQSVRADESHEPQRQEDDADKQQQIDHANLLPSIPLNFLRPSR